MGKTLMVTLRKSGERKVACAIECEANSLHIFILTAIGICYVYKRTYAEISGLVEFKCL